MAGPFGKIRYFALKRVFTVLGGYSGSQRARGVAMAISVEFRSSPSSGQDPASQWRGPPADVLGFPASRGADAEPHITPWPVPVRLAIVVVGSAVCWAPLLWLAQLV